MCYIVIDGAKQTRYLTTQEVAALLGLRTRAWVHRLVEQGHLEVVARLHLHPRSKDFLLFRAEDVLALRALREKYPPVNGAKWVYPQAEYNKLKKEAKANVKGDPLEMQKLPGMIVPADMLLSPAMSG